MDKDSAIKILRDNFEKLTDNHLDTLRFLIKQLYKLFDSIITISVAIVGIVIPIIINSDHYVNNSILWGAFTIFTVVILIGIGWRYINLKKGELEWPKILSQASDSFNASSKEIRESENKNYYEIIKTNFVSTSKKSPYRVRIFEIVFIIIFCLGIILLYVSLLPNKDSTTLKDFGEARIGLNGEKVNLLVADIKGQLGKLFVFEESDKSILTSLSVENPNIEGPDFRIVSGNKRDWLVVTTMGNNGTGYIKKIDTWYIANPYFMGDPVVLSYPSGGQITGWTGLPNQKLTTNIANVSGDDHSIDVIFSIEKCIQTDQCNTESKKAHYIWDDGSSKFILDKEKSNITSGQITNLLNL